MLMCLLMALVLDVAMLLRYHECIDSCCCGGFDMYIFFTDTFDHIELSRLPINIEKFFWSDGLRIVDLGIMSSASSLATVDFSLSLRVVLVGGNLIPLPVYSSSGMMASASS